MKKINKNKIKTWFVTGASSGLGAELCRQLVKRDYNVIAVSRRVPDIQGALCLSVDVTQPDTIQKAVDTGMEYFGGIDVLANFAGISCSITFEEETAENMEQIINTNFYGTYNTCKALIKYFRENNKGTIINCSSVIGLVPRIGGSAYSSSKHAIEGLTSVLQLETRKINTRVMCVEPGLYATEIGKGRWETTAYKEYEFSHNQIIKVPRPYRNDIIVAMNSIIDTAENLKMPRRLMLGKDCILRVKYEIGQIAYDIKYSSKISRKIARVKNGSRQFTIFDELAELAKESIQNIFSFKNEYQSNKKHKVISLFGIKMKFKTSEIRTVVREGNPSTGKKL